MKWWLFLVSLLLLMRPAYAADELPRELLQAAPGAAQAYEQLERGGSAIGAFSRLAEDGLKEAKHHMTAGVRRAALLAAGVMLLSLVELLDSGRKGQTRTAVTLAGTLWITAVSAGDMENMMGLGRSAVEQLERISKFLIPALAAAAAAGGGVTAAGTFQAAAVFFSDLLLTVMDDLLLPGVYVYVGLCAVSAVVESSAAEKAAQLLKKGITWSLVSLLGLYTAFLALGGAAAGAADRRAVQAAKTVVSTAVPVVGRVLSEAAETLLADAGLLRAALGSFGVLAVVSVCAAPVLRLGWQYLLYQGASLAALFGGTKELARLLERLSGAFALVLAMTAAAAMLLMISVLSVLKVAVL